MKNQLFRLKSINYFASTFIIPQIIFLLSFNTNAQTSLKNELANLDSLEQVLTEKVHLHMDRSIFSPGEDIWFKAYLLEGTIHVLSSTSHNLHVELISPDGKIIDSKIIMLLNGVGYGDIYIDKKKYSEGTYKIRAYTNFMRNFGEDIFFTKDILIKEIIEEKENVEDFNKPELDLKFFPEGGNLVQGVSNKIAFKATNKYGKGVNIRFSLFDEENKLILSASSLHNGMGYLNLLPEPNKIYYAIIDSVGIDDKKFSLPSPVVGYSIVVGNQFKNLLDFQVNTSPENVFGQKLKYTIQSRGILFTINEVVMDKLQKSVRIEKEKLPEGISCITLYDENDIPVCERLIFNQFYKKILIDIHTDKKEYGPREKVNITIETRDEQGNPLPSNLSLAIIDQYINQTEKKAGIESAGIVPSILLNADLKGEIADPMYYFENFDMKKHFLLDLVLLTHGWRKYIWKEMVNKNTLTLDFEYEKGFSFSGIANSLVFSKPVADSKVTLAIMEDGIYFKENKSDINGRFRFDNVYFQDATEVIFQAYNKNDKRRTSIILDENNYQIPKIKLSDQHATNYLDINLNKFINQTAQINRLRDSLEAKKHIFIDEISVTAKRKVNDGHHRIYKEADFVLEVDDVMESYPDIFSMLRARLPGVQIMGACPDVQVIIRGFSSMVSDNSAGCVLNGMFVDIETLCSISPFDVDKIEVLNGTTAGIFGSRGGNGIVAVYTKKGPDRQQWPPVGIEVKKPKGYYRAREFYVPDYDKPQEEFSGTDLRNTLFWEPLITTDADGKAQVSFFNSDKAADYNIKVEGVGLAGGIGENNYYYQITTDSN